MRGTVVGGGRNGRGVFLAEATGGATDLSPNLEKGRRRRGESDKQLWLPLFSKKGNLSLLVVGFPFVFQVRPQPNIWFSIVSNCVVGGRDVRKYNICGGGLLLLS